MKILSPGKNFRILPICSRPVRKYRIGIFGHRAAQTGKNPGKNSTHHWCKVLNENTLSWSKFSNFTHLLAPCSKVPNRNFQPQGGQNELKILEKIYVPLVQSFEVQEQHSIECRMPSRHFRTLHQSAAQMFSKWSSMALRQTTIKQN